MQPCCSYQCSSAAAATSSFNVGISIFSIKADYEKDSSSCISYPNFVFFTIRTTASDFSAMYFTVIKARPSLLVLLPNCRSEYSCKCVLASLGWYFNLWKTIFLELMCNSHSIRVGWS